MIRLAMITRTTDGMPLCASTDSAAQTQNDDFQETYRQLKILSRKMGNFPEKCSYQTDNYSIHSITSLQLSFFLLCDKLYPTILAFSFLDEIARQFYREFDNTSLMDKSRPYAFISYENTLQKVKQRYNNPRSLTTKVDLSKLSQEIRKNPPYDISQFELDVGKKSNKTENLKTYAMYGGKFLPLGIGGALILLLNVVCAFLNLGRGVTVLNEGHIDSFDSDVNQHGAAFILTSLLCVYQSFLLYYPAKQRRPLACATLGSICLCQLYLSDYRNTLQIAFHVAVSAMSTCMIFMRKGQEKLPQYIL